MKRFVSSLLFVLSLMIFNLNGFAQTTLTILHINDTHSTLSSVGPRTNTLDGTQGGIARAASLIGFTKLSEPNVLALHAGDFSVGDLFYTTTFGAAELQILNSVGLDAMTLGNHEFDLTPAALTGALQAAFPTPDDGFPILSANAILSDPSLAVLDSYVSDYTTKQFGTVKVGIFGLTTPETNVISQPAPAIISDDIMTIAATMVATLQAQGCQVIIFLSHLGYNLDKLVAANIPGINVIVGGHDHYLFEQPQVIPNAGGATLIVQAKSNYLYAGKMHLNIDALGNVSLLDYSLIPLDQTIPEEPTVLAVVNGLISNIEAVYGPVYTQQCGYAARFFEEEGLDLMKQGVHDTPVGNLVADAFRWKTGTQIAIEAGGSTAMALYQGPIVPADLFRLTGYGFNTINGLGFQLVTFEITGTGLLTGLAFGLSDIENTDEYIINVSGMEYIYDSNLPPNERLIFAKVGNNIIDPSATYSVTANEFVPMFLNMLGIPISNLQVLSGQTEFQTLVEYVVAQGGLIYPKTQGRITNIDSRPYAATVRGLGIYNSPAGSFTSNPNLTGRISFEFLVRKMRNLPVSLGVFAVQHLGSNFKFTATSMDWMFVDENTSQLKGKGKLNGQSGYRFLAFVTDGRMGLNPQGDKIRLAIWNEATNQLVYDNFIESQIRIGNIVINRSSLGKESVDELAVLPNEFILSQNYPNPFNPSTSIQYQVSRSSNVSLKVFDILGNEIATLVNEEKEPGIYRKEFNAFDYNLASGIYLYRLQAGSFVETRKMILMK